MKVCILTHTFPKNEKDVSAAFMKEFADGLVDAGSRVVVVTPFDTNFRRKGDKFKIYTYKYIWPERFHLLGYSKTMEADVELRKKAYILLPFLLFFGTISLYRVVKREKVDLISVHWILPNGVMAFVVSKLTGIPYAITLPGTDAYLAYRFKAFGLVAKIVALGSSAIFSNSSLHLKRIQGLGIGEKINDVISYPIDVSKFKPSKKGVDILQKKLSLNRKNFVVLAVGRLVYKKGFIYLLKSLKYLVSKYPNIRVVIGGEGDLKDELLRFVNANSLQDYVNFVGTISRDEMNVYHNLSDVVVAPSIVDRKGNVDGGPVVSFESMACAKPQIATSVLGVADILKDGVNGFVVPQKSSKAIASAISKLIKSKNLRILMGQRNRLLIKTQVSTKNVGRRYKKYFEKILAS